MAYSRIPFLFYTHSSQAQGGLAQADPSAGTVRV